MNARARLGKPDLDGSLLLLHCNTCRGFSVAGALRAQELKSSPQLRAGAPGGAAAQIG